MRLFLRVAILAIALPMAVNAQADKVRTAVSHAEAKAILAGAQAPSMSITSSYTSERSGITHVYMRQVIADLEVIGTEASVNVDRSGRVFHAVGTDNFVEDRASALLLPTPRLLATDAAEVLARTNGLRGSFDVVVSKGGPDRAATLSDGGVALEPVAARLVWHRDEVGTLRLAWEIGLYEQSAIHYWLGYVDANTGAVLAQMDLVVNENHEFEAHDAAAAPASVMVAPPTSATSFLGTISSMTGPQYRVFEAPVEAPYYSTPASPSDGRTLAVNPAIASASPLGWHNTGSTSYAITRGNNAHAYTDLDANNVADAGSEPNGGTSLHFDFPVNFTQAPSTYRPAAVTNLFYWNNVVHDVMYQYGFNEAAGNFQTNNFGNGGAGNDAVRAEAQDGSGTNNANFFTPADGSAPRMQMYIGTSPNPDVDGDFDNGVIVHEYGHGISTRLTGGPGNSGCLNNDEQMGEGWSDFYGLMFTMKPGATGTQSRAIGNYLFGYGPNGGGIRLAPYSTDFGVNNYTYGSTKSMRAVHQIGFVWASALWEATWELINEHGFSADIYNASGTAGNQVMLRLVTEGLKLQPCSPGFVSGRDAILAADASLYGGAHTAKLQAAFARRGLGYSASEGSTSRNRDNREAFDLWPGTSNNAPNASFTYSCSALACSFSDTSSDSDGTIASRSWSFGDGATSTSTNPSNTYSASGTYAVSLTVSDNEGATGTASQSVTVSSGGGGAIVLSASPRTAGPWSYADLTWTPADGGNVTVSRNGSVVTTTADDGAYSDRIGRNTSGSYTYRVCETDTGICSNDASVTYFSNFAGAGSALGAQPNPFSSSTTVRFELTEQSEVDVSVFNSLGQRVAVIASGTFEEGVHSADFDAADLPSGIYVYRVQAGADVQTGRMMLTR